jgi:hypothetical protein
MPGWLGSSSTFTINQEQIDISLSPNNVYPRTRLLFIAVGPAQAILTSEDQAAPNAPWVAAAAAPPVFLFDQVAGVMVPPAGWVIAGVVHFGFPILWTPATRYTLSSGPGVRFHYVQHQRTPTLHSPQTPVPAGGTRLFTILNWGTHTQLWRSTN